MKLKKIISGTVVDIASRTTGKSMRKHETTGTTTLTSLSQI